jgi:hypothetical protein
MIVWDDEADVAPADTIVEVWHLGATAAAAQRQGHRIVAAADGPLYFDAVQGAASQEPPGTRYMSTLEEVYSFSVPPRAFGVEAVVWIEYLSSESELWYALLPRESAFGAVALRGSRKAPWRSFRDRALPRDLQWLMKHGYTFRIPNTLFSVDDPRAGYTSVAGNQDAAMLHTFRPRVMLTLASLMPGARILYRTDPLRAWQAYGKPLNVPVVSGTRIDARTVAPDGRSSAVSSVFFSASRAQDSSKDFDDVVSP